MLNQKMLKEILDYNPDTGIFTWKISSKKIKIGDIAGSKHKSGYIRIFYKMKCYKAHRLAWIYTHGKTPIEIDHINGIRSDNRIINLRNATKLDNRKNKGISSLNTSGITGVKLAKSGNWESFIGSQNKSIHLGTFRDKNLATEVRLKAQKDYQYHENHGNIREKYQPS